MNIAIIRAREDVGLGRVLFDDVDFLDREYLFSNQGVQT